MLMIRFRKAGKRGERKYRVVVTEKRERREGPVVEMLGWYEKSVKGVRAQIDKDKVALWVSKGAQVSPAVKQALEASK